MYERAQYTFLTLLKRSGGVAELSVIGVCVVRELESKKISKYPRDL